MLAPPMCFACDRYQQDETTDGHICKAFPEGIPAIIWFSRFDHRNPHDGDHRLQYKPRRKSRFLMPPSASPYLRFSPDQPVPPGFDAAGKPLRPLDPKVLR